MARPETLERDAQLEAAPQSRFRREAPRVKALGTADSSFLLATLARDCHPLQFLRELTQNAAEAGASTVLWDVDWERFIATKGREKKLACVDDGTGMDADALEEFVGNLAASDAEKKQAGRNFGMGLKVACVHANPAGTQVASWQHATGARATLLRGSVKPVAYQLEGPYPIDFTPPILIDDAGHGTMVSLLGHKPTENTTVVPKSVLEGRTKWIRRALNTRYFVPPRGVKIQVREDFKLDFKAPRAGGFQQVHGQRHYLQARSEASGFVDLDESRVHWWLLDENAAGRKRDGDVWASSGHVAALYQDELYDLHASTHGGYARLSDFGIRLGQDRVVIYVEPRLREPLEADGTPRVSPTTVRTTLQIDGAELPWDSWALAFQEQLPLELADLQERLGARSEGGDHRAWVIEHLTRVRRLFRPSRNRAPLVRAGGSDWTPQFDASHHPGAGGDGDVAIGSVDFGELADDGERFDEPPVATIDAPSGEPPAFEDIPDAAPGDRPPARERLERTVVGDEESPESLALFASLIPDIRWVTAADGTRALGDFEDRAARYDQARNELLINADFWAYRDLLRDFANEPRFRRARNAKTVIEATVQAYVSGQLVEAVITARQYEGRPGWSDDDIDALLSPNGLTSALAPRSLMWAAVNKRLAQKLR